jgi:DNA adenine methylase
MNTRAVTAVLSRLPNSVVRIPPLKSQGIKSKLVPWIRDQVPGGFSGAWIEPFMGTGAVGLNIAHAINVPQLLLCDSNPHLVNFYQAIQTRQVNTNSVRRYLEHEGQQLALDGDHYYRIRERFNLDHDPLDFLFLNRAGFNGMMRFNRDGHFNIPFCRKPLRFSKSYITKIVNQVAKVEEILSAHSIEFKHQPFETTIANASKDGLIYCDPPYIGRHADYFNQWDGTCEQRLFDCLSNFKGHFMLSTWHHTQFRHNKYIDSLWSRYRVMTREHFYHVGGREENRNAVVEALVMNW